jgi:hypothetical protein
MPNPINLLQFIDLVKQAYAECDGNLRPLCDVPETINDVKLHIANNCEGGILRHDADLTEMPPCDDYLPVWESWCDWALLQVLKAATKVALVYNDDGDDDDDDNDLPPAAPLMAAPAA